MITTTTTDKRNKNTKLNHTMVLQEKNQLTMVDIYNICDKRIWAMSLGLQPSKNSVAGAVEDSDQIIKARSKPNLSQKDISRALNSPKLDCVPMAALWNQGM